MIDMTKSVTVTRAGFDVMTFSENQFFTFGKILLTRKNEVIVLVAGVAKKKVTLPNVFPATIDGVTYVVDVPDAPVAVSTDKPKRERPVAGAETKISICKRIFAEMQGGVIGGSDKAAIVARFVSEANCTPAGANTYFITCMKG